MQISYRCFVAASIMLAGCTGRDSGANASDDAQPVEVAAATVAAEESGTAAPAPSESAQDSEQGDERGGVFPVALRGTWRETDGPAPTASACNGNASENIGKVLNVRAESFGIFEEGGRIIEVRKREEGLLRAVFDTTYADTPTRDELTFAVDPNVKTLTVTNHDPGEESIRTYKRCS